LQNKKDSSNKRTLRNGTLPKCHIWKTKNVAEREEERSQDAEKESHWKSRPRGLKGGGRNWTKSEELFEEERRKFGVSGKRKHKGDIEVEKTQSSHRAGGKGLAQAEPATGPSE